MELKNKKILITAPIHQSKEIFKEYLLSLSNLLIPENYEAFFYFYLHNCSELKELLKENQYEEVLDNSKYNFFSHDFKNENYSALSYIRTKALQKAREENFDYVFSVDSDVLIHPKTLIYLLKDNQDIAGMINWSKSFSGDKILPNCYDLEYWRWWENNSILMQKGLYERGIISATVLLGKRIIQNEKIDYYPIPNIECSQWEDYALSLKAHIMIPDLKMSIDTKLPCRHLYKEKDYIRWIEEKKEYE